MVNDPHHQHSAYLEALGIQAWYRREEAASVSVSGNALLTADEPQVTTQPEPQVVAPVVRPAVDKPLDWPELEARVRACTACELHTTRTQTVFGVGNRQAQLMVIGEAPGADEDRQGEPFVGRAGQLLNSMLAAIGLKRDEVFIANILKCRPPNNRDPNPEEAAACASFLSQQLALVKPRVILAVGRVAAQNLLATDAAIGSLRGRMHHYGESATPLVVTYHPAYLLRSPLEKRKAWQDLRLALQTLRNA